jgi:hypothetical protein
MARFGRSVPLMQRPKPLRPLVIADDFMTINSWVEHSGGGTSNMPTTHEFFANAGQWSIKSHVDQLDSDDFYAEFILGQMVGTVNGSQDSNGVGLQDASGNGIWMRMSAGGSEIYVTNGWVPGTNWGTSKNNGSIVGNVSGDRIGASRIGNVYQMYKNGLTTGMASWVDTGNITPKGLNCRFPIIGAYNSGAGQARFMDAAIFRSLKFKAA